MKFVKVGHWYINMEQVAAVEAIERSRVVFSGGKSGEQLSQLEVQVFLAGSSKPIELHKDEAEMFMAAFKDIAAVKV